jgi:hypothetical protein
MKATSTPATIPTWVDKTERESSLYSKMILSSTKVLVPGKYKGVGGGGVLARYSCKRNPLDWL